MSARRLIVFARLPMLGRVKTRLAAGIGPQRALAAYRRLLAHTLRVARAAPVDRRELRFVSDAEADAVDTARDGSLPAHLAARGWSVGPQRGADLGARMNEALGAALALCEHAVLVGCDCPVLMPDDIDAAFVALERSDAVFLPAEDGGYALVGLSRPLPEIFDAMPWGTSEVMAQTLQRLSRAGARATLLRTVWDVDEARDLARWDASKPGRPTAGR